MAAKKEHYVNNKEFLEAMKAYKKEVNKAKREKREKPPVTDYIGSCFLKIANHLSYRPNFINYTFRDDMISDGIENCLQYLDNFNPAKSSNPFAYFTQIIYYAFLRRIQKEKKQLYVKYKATEQIGILDEFEMLEFEDGTSKQFELYDNIAEFIENYEEAKEKKKEIKKPKGIEKFLGE